MVAGGVIHGGFGLVAMGVDDDAALLEVGLVDAEGVVVVLVRAVGVFKGLCEFGEVEGGGVLFTGFFFVDAVGN